MIWETNPLKRIGAKQMNIVSTHDVVPGDFLVGEYGDSGASVWEVKEVQEKKHHRLKAGIISGLS